MKELWRKLKVVLYDGFLFIVIYEILEEILEDLIALAITDILFGILSRIFCITIAQVIKYSVKKVIKTLTRREGDDKMKLLKKIFYGIYFNKCTIVMSLLSAFSAYSAYLMAPLPLWSRIVIGAAILIIGIICSINIGWESYNEIIDRLTKNKEKRAEKKRIKEQKNKEKEILKKAKNKEKEIRKLAKRIEKDKVRKLKQDKKAQIASLKIRLLDEAKREYELKIAQEEVRKRLAQEAQKSSEQPENKQ